KQEFASELRRSATNAEHRLWSLLRNRQLGGLRFRRQQPIGPYVVDFYCSAAKLIVELDGDQHGEDRHVRYDADRTRWLTAHGYRVLRFSNGVFLQNPNTVFEGIWNALDDSGVPLPKPPSAV
ncbi:MAG: DUF559 domain-containing protein, partial [Alphaproteobacteria bacterium]|nr:DUF559 domain-containing protein [Alphaproteobacteria bacterium]